jgi:hypothetical protein
LYVSINIIQILHLQTTGGGTIQPSDLHPTQ